MPQLITLTSDFGRDSPYVAAMKGVILSINPAASIVDISHAIGPQNIAEGAFVLGEVTPWFPPDSIHVAVVDPGVGTQRKIAYARQLLATAEVHEEETEPVPARIPEIKADARSIAAAAQAFAERARMRVNGRAA